MIIIGISGKKNSGKDTIADIISCTINNILNTDNLGIPIYKIMFSEPLKRFIADLTGEPLTKMFSSKFYENDIYDFTVEQRKIVTSFKGNLTIGELMQIIATEGLRDNFDPEIWIKAFSNRIETFDSKSVVIIPDLRFENELHFLMGDIIEDNNTYFIRVNRDNIEDDNRSSDHRSEIELDDHGDDFKIIHNNGNIDMLINVVGDYVTSDIIQKIISNSFDDSKVSNILDSINSPF